MSNDNPIREKLKRSIEASLRKSSWHSLAAALDGLTEEEAGWHPERFAGFPWADGSIRGIVFHVAGDILVQLSHAYGDRSLDWEAVQKLEEFQSGTLAAGLALLERAGHELTAVLEGLNDEELQREVTIWGGKTMSGEQFFDMLIEHGFYHAGQIRYIRCLIGGR